MPQDWSQYSEPSAATPETSDNKWSQYAVVEKAQPSSEDLDPLGRPYVIPPVSKTESVVRGFAETASLGTGKWVNALVREGFNWSNILDSVEGQKKANSEAFTTNPGSYIAGGVAGAVGQGAALLKSGVGFAGQVAQGAGLGAISGLTNSTTAQQAVVNTLTGSVLGGAGTALIGGGSKLLGMGLDKLGKSTVVSYLKDLTKTARGVGAEADQAVKTLKGHLLELGTVSNNAKRSTILKEAEMATKQLTIKPSEHFTGPATPQDLAFAAEQQMKFAGAVGKEVKEGIPLPGVTDIVSGLAASQLGNLLPGGGVIAPLAAGILGGAIKNPRVYEDIAKRSGLGYITNAFGTRSLNEGIQKTAPVTALSGLTGTLGEYIKNMWGEEKPPPIRETPPVVPYTPLTYNGGSGTPPRPL